ncbi:MAG: hypothetical protein M0Q14_06865 [Tissierellaceae bacterium]|nr:hypothetical protein [Tissierellaceae bacterium]
MDLDREKDLNYLIKGIKEIKGQDCTRLYMEGQERINEDILKHIGKDTGLQINTGENIRKKYLPIIIEKILNLEKGNRESKEILIICHDKEKIKDLIREISKRFGLITVFGCQGDDEEELYDYVLEEIGLSLFLPTTIEAIMGNYSIIVNYSEHKGVDISKKKKNCLVFDFGSKNITHREKGTGYITDFGFTLKKTNIGRNKWMDEVISSAAFESLLEENYTGEILFFVGNDPYSTREYINTYIKVKGRF